LNEALSKYAAADHVYAETMRAWGMFTRGRVAERLRDFESAQADYERTYQLAETHDHRVGIGAHWVKAKLGCARIAFHRQDRRGSDRMLAEAVDMLERRNRFVWLNLAGCTQADSYYEIGATHALRGDVELALQALDAAARVGWADENQLRHDPNFDALRDSPALEELLARAAAAVTLPAPVGAGGFPDLV